MNETCTQQRWLRSLLCDRHCAKHWGHDHRFTSWRKMLKEPNSTSHPAATCNWNHSFLSFFFLSWFAVNETKKSWSETSPRKSTKYQMPFTKNCRKDILNHVFRCIILKDKLPVIQLNFKQHYLNEKYQSVRYPSKNSSNFLPGC